MQGPRTPPHLPTVSENLTALVPELRSLLEELLLRHSSIYKWNTEGGSVVIIPTSGNYSYRELNADGRRLQSRALELYRKLYALFCTLLRGQAADTLSEFEDAYHILEPTLQQNHTSCTTTTEAFERACEALDTLTTLLARLYDPSEDSTIYVPDTNALIYHPDLEHWTCHDAHEFTILLLPTVLSELDSLKTTHRREEVREKAEKLIRKLKEYRRRGRLPDGVPLVRERSTIRTHAVEPDFASSLPWLDPENNDDRLLAGFVEVIRIHTRSRVLLVTRDINLQNKAEHACLPYCEPPEPDTAS